MPRRQRNQQIMISFDGLTDAVTNLVGALILLVVLILGVTHVARPGRSNRESSLQTVPATDLLQRIHVLEMEAELIDRQIVRIERELPELTQRVQTLLERSKSSSHEDDSGQAPRFLQESTDRRLSDLATVSSRILQKEKP